MITMAFDQSLANSGWSLLQVLDDKVHLIDYGTIKTKPSDEFIDRLISIESELERLVFKFTPDIVFLEEVHCPRNSPYAWPKLLVVESVYKIWLRKNNISNISINPKKNNKNSWRYILGISSSDKKATKELFSNLNINEHIADSLAINIAGLYIKNLVITQRYTATELIKSFF